VVTGSYLIVIGVTTGVPTPAILTTLRGDIAQLVLHLLSESVEPRLFRVIVPGRFYSSGNILQDLEDPILPSDPLTPQFLDGLFWVHPQHVRYLVGRETKRLRHGNAVVEQPGFPMRIRLSKTVGNGGSDASNSSRA